jgi:hypothetical protein
MRLRLYPRSWISGGGLTLTLATAVNSDCPYRDRQFHHKLSFVGLDVMAQESGRLEDERDVLSLKSPAYFSTLCSIGPCLVRFSCKPRNSSLIVYRMTMTSFERLPRMNL